MRTKGSAQVVIARMTAQGIPSKASKKPVTNKGSMLASRRRLATTTTSSSSHDPQCSSSSAAATELGESCPLLDLSAEILTEIVTYLHPREAIFFSLTCRALYHGVLSSKNYFLWYKLGGFEQGMPGFKEGWTANTNPISDAHAAQATSTTISMCSSKRAASEESASPTSSKKAKTTTTRSYSTKKALQKAVKHYSPTNTVIDYKRILIETMLGDAHSGCQWCLARPNTRKIYTNWKLRLCEECFWDNVITVFACKPLGIDISQLPVHDQNRRGGTLHGVWKPSVQKLVNQTAVSFVSTPNPLSIIPPAPPHPSIPFPTVDSILLDRRSTAAKAKANAASALKSLRGDHVTAVFNCIKRLYERLYNEASLTSFKESMFARVMEKIPPSKLKREWFIEIDENSQMARLYPEWKSYWKENPYVQILKRVKLGMSGPKLYEDTEWVNDWADIFLLGMKDALIFGGRSASFKGVTTILRPNQLPYKCLLNEAMSLAKSFHITRLRSTGAEQIFAKARKRGLNGIQCPWGSCHYGDLSTHPSQSLVKPTMCSLMELMGHLAMYHKEVLLLGDVDWLSGQPSRWWLKNPPRVKRHNGEQEKEEWFREEVQQEKWLRNWWGERWIDDQVDESCQTSDTGKGKGKAKEVEARQIRVIGHRKTMRQWAEDGGFWGYSERLCKCYEPPNRIPGDTIFVIDYLVQRCVRSGCKSII